MSTNKNKFLARPLAHSGVKWQYDIVVQRRLGYVSFSKTSLFKSDLPQKPPVDKASPFHRGFSHKDFVYQSCVFSYPSGDLTFLYY